MFDANLIIYNEIKEYSSENHSFFCSVDVTIRFNTIIKYHICSLQELYPLSLIQKKCLTYFCHFIFLRWNINKSFCF